MNENVLRRPLSLAEVATESATYSDFGYNLKDFLHEVARIRTAGGSLLPMFEAEPIRLAERFKEGQICDAFLAATADYLSRTNGLVTPLWALQEDRVLQEPWFSEEFPEVRMRLLRDTPSAFKDKNIFVFESALQVA